MTMIPSEIDRVIYMESISEGLTEFPTACPDWCTERHLMQHRVPDDSGGVRVHSQHFGLVDICCLERLSNPGALYEWTCSIDRVDELTLDQVRELGRDAERAAEWFAANATSAR